MDHIRKHHPSIVSDVELYRKQGSVSVERQTKAQKTINEIFKPFTKEEVSSEIIFIVNSNSKP